MFSIDALVNLYYIVLIPSLIEHDETTTAGIRPIEMAAKKGMATVSCQAQRSVFKNGTLASQFEENRRELWYRNSGVFFVFEMAHVPQHDTLPADILIHYSARYRYGNSRAGDLRR